MPNLVEEPMHLPPGRFEIEEAETTFTTFFGEGQLGDDTELAHTVFMQQRSYEQPDFILVVQLAVGKSMVSEVLADFDREASSRRNGTADRFRGESSSESLRVHNLVLDGIFRKLGIWDDDISHIAGGE